MRAPAQTTLASARETRTSVNELIVAQSGETIEARVQEAPKSAECHTPLEPTAYTSSGDSCEEAILVMNGAAPPPFSTGPMALVQLAPPSRVRCRPLNW
jgi:hypothetical protein